jgi:hypothetical protein
VCHGCSSSRLRRNGVDPDFREILSVALMLLVVLAPTHLEDRHFVVPTLRDYRCRNASTGNQWPPQLKLVAFAHCQYFLERDFLANVRWYLFYFQFFAGGNTILLASGFYDRVHDDLIKNQAALSSRDDPETSRTARLFPERFSENLK